MFESRPPDHIVTVESLEADREACPPDHADELEPGCKTWTGPNPDGSAWSITVWPSGVGAIYKGGDSVWGDWNEAMATLTTDDGYIYDIDGEVIARPGE